jgi:hypothetical protein
MIGALTLRGFDIHASSLRAELVAVDLSGLTAPVVLAAVSSSTSIGPFETPAQAAIGPAIVVDNAKYAYAIHVTSVGVWQASTLQILGATVSYTMAAPLE